MLLISVNYNFSLYRIYLLYFVLIVKFFLNQLPQKFQFGYSYLDNEVKKSEANFSQYSINSMKHQFVGNYAMEWFKNFSNSVSYRYVERTSGVSYNIWDINASYRLKAVELSLYANNIFNTESSI